MMSRRHWTIARVAAVAVTLSGTTGWASYPTASLPDRPSPLPALPEDFRPFAPPVANISTHAEAPALAEWTRSNDPGDTLIVTGSRLSACSGEEEGRDSQFVVYGQSDTAAIITNANIQRISGQQAAITLPDGLPTPSMYIVWPKNDKGFGVPALLNRTEAWWVGPHTATRRDKVSVFGRNLTAGDDGDTCWIYLQAADDSGAWLTSSTANPYKADFIVPDNAASGTYQVWVHNGLGEQYGWSGPLELTIDDGIDWTGPEIDVMAYGAMGDGVADDSDAIYAAIGEAAATPGTTIYFPEGTYLISHDIRDLPEHTRLRGAGMDLTTIAAHPNFTTNVYGMLLGSMHKVAFVDLTFDTKGRVSGHLDNNIAHIRGSSRVEFRSVRFSQLEDSKHASIIDVHLCELITFRNCTFVAAEAIFLGEAQQVFIGGCDFRGVHDNNSLINEWGGRDISITDCTAADYDSSDPSDGRGWCQGRFLAGHGVWGAIRNLYFGGNRTTDMTVRPDFYNQNTGEQFMMEGLDTQYRGAALSAGESTVQLANLTTDYTDQILVIVRGPGMGQSRVITAFDPATGTVTVDKDWRVTPTTDTVIMIGHYMTRMAVYDNYFDGKERAVTNATHIASAGVEPYGGCVDIEVARNRFHQLRFGISNWSLGWESAESGRLDLQPNYFNTFKNNEFEHCREGAENLIAAWVNLPLVEDVGVLGNVFRKNHMNDILGSAFTSESWVEGATVEMCVFDQNTATNVGMGAWCGTDRLQNHVLVRNHFGGRGGAALALQPDHFPALRENTWEGFAADPIYGAPGAILELPQRTVAFSCALGQSEQSALPVWNSGTTPLSWQAYSTSDWKARYRSTTLT